MVRALFIGLIVASALFLTVRNPALAGGLGALTFAALAVRRQSRRGSEDPPGFEDRTGFETTGFVTAAPDRDAEPIEDVRSPDPRLTQAMNLGRRELGRELTDDPDDIEFSSSVGRSRIRVGYHTDVPFVALRQTLGDDRELTFVIRRRHSMLGLPRVVDNTPVDTANFEYRLREIDLRGDLGRRFIAATNRPRLFRELVAGGFASDLSEALDDSRHRLEDVTYGGDSLTLLIQPAADPATTPWVYDTLAFARPLTSRIHRFLSDAYIPSAKS